MGIDVQKGMPHWVAGHRLASCWICTFIFWSVSMVATKLEKILLAFNSSTKKESIADVQVWISHWIISKFSTEHHCYMHWVGELCLTSVVCLGRSHFQPNRNCPICFATYVIRFGTWLPITQAHATRLKFCTEILFYFPSTIILHNVIYPLRSA